MSAFCYARIAETALKKRRIGHCFVPSCGYRAAEEGGVYTILPSLERQELYPGDRADIIDFSLPGHETRLGNGWFALEGREGAKYRWMSGEGHAILERVREGEQRLRIRGNAHAGVFAGAKPVELSVFVNGASLPPMRLERPGLFVLEADLPPAANYQIRIKCSQVFTAPPDLREFSVTVSMVRLIPRDGRTAA